MHVLDATRFQGVTSSVAYVNASVVQGSVAGPASFIICTSTLQPKHRMNIQVKYAEDAYLLIGSENIHTAEEERKIISIWAQPNNLRLNSLKSEAGIWGGLGGRSPNKFEVHPSPQYFEK